MVTQYKNNYEFFLNQLIFIVYGAWIVLSAKLMLSTCPSSQWWTVAKSFDQLKRSWCHGKALIL